jgi:hypothetical protein
MKEPNQGFAPHAPMAHQLHSELLWRGVGEVGGRA